MARRIAFGILWFVVFYFGVCMVIGGAAGAIESSRIQPGESSFDAGRNAGADAVAPLRPYIVLGSVCVAAAGTYFGLLPGTSKRRDESSD